MWPIRWAYKPSCYGRHPKIFLLVEFSNTDMQKAPVDNRTYSSRYSLRDCSSNELVTAMRSYLLSLLKASTVGHSPSKSRKGALCSIVKYGTDNPSSNPWRNCFISHYFFWKMQKSIWSLSSYGEIVWQTRFFNVGKKSIPGERKTLNSNQLFSALKNCHILFGVETLGKYSIEFSTLGKWFWSWTLKTLITQIIFF